MKKYRQSIILIIINTVISLICGLLIGKTMIDAGYGIIPTYLLFFATVVISYVVQTAVHEAGHLVFGLLTGYRFRSYRIFSLLFTVENGRLKLSRYSIAGTAGQCLMSSPTDRSKKPYFLYNLGGVLFNILSYMIFTIPAVFAGSAIIRVLSIGQIMMALLNALGNGIPKMIGGISSDGDNLLEMTKHPSSIDCFYAMLDINDMQMDGKEMSEVPDEMFITDEAVLHNGTLGSSGMLYREAKQMNQHDFDSALATIREIREKDLPLNSISEFGLLLDETYINCLKGEFIPLEDKIFERYLKTTATSPSTLRYLYVRALYNKDNTAAEKHLAAFRKLENTYPYKGEYRAERELMELAERQLDSNPQVSF